jgi:hypothetical protein
LVLGENKSLVPKIGGGPKRALFAFLKAIDSEKVRWYTNPE